MAEKRAKDRVILKLIGISGDIIQKMKLMILKIPNLEE